MFIAPPKEKQETPVATATQNPVAPSKTANLLPHLPGDVFTCGGGGGGSVTGLSKISQLSSDKLC